MLVNGAIVPSDVLIGVDNFLITDNVPVFGDLFEIQIDNEIMKVAANNGSTFTVIRGIRGTFAAAHNDNSIIINITGKTAAVPNTFTDTHGRLIILDGSLSLGSSGILSINNSLITDTDGTTITFDASKSPFHQVVLAGNRTVVLANMTIGRTIKILFTQDGTGSRLITWPSGIRWAGGTAPTLTVTASKSDLVKLTQIDSTPHYLGSIIQNY